MFVCVCVCLGLSLSQCVYMCVHACVWMYVCACVCVNECVCYPVCVLAILLWAKINPHILVETLFGSFLAVATVASSPMYITLPVWLESFAKVLLNLSSCFFLSFGILCHKYLSDGIIDIYGLILELVWCILNLALLFHECTGQQEK